jgi:hypothetical protein
MATNPNTLVNNTIGQRLAWTFRPFLTPGIEKLSDVDPTIRDMGAAIDKQYSYLIAWVFSGQFTYEGLTYRKGVNEHSAMIILRHLYTNTDL